MSYYITGETIKSATSIKLGEIFDNPTRYKENVTNQTYPNFHIIQVTLTPEPKGLSGRGTSNRYKDRRQFDYLVNIQYRLAQNTDTIVNLRQQLDAVGLKLCAEFTELNLEKPVKVKNSYYEIVDGVLQFFFNVTIFVTPEITEDALLQEYELNEEVI